jgi:CRISPR-associated endonuclease/helicase Cas3
MVTYQSEPLDLRSYFADARLRAREFLERTGFQAHPETSPLRIADLLPLGAEANGMQLAAELLAEEPFRLVVIEAPTGEGKTEAALRLAESGRALGRGVFFALPTMATANGLVSRIDRYLQAAVGGPKERARLLHSGAWLVRREGETLANPGDQEMGLDAEDWFAGSKRGLLDRFGVGTIDQALMGALQVRHFFVRLFALSGKTVVIDEVHAYDVYMGSLIDLLLAWLKALDCRVILVSATLPSSRRRELLASWGCLDAPEAHYPRITALLQDGRSQAKTFSVKTRKALRIQPWVCDSAECLDKAVDILFNRLREGAKTAALIVNTVGRAQKALASALSHPDAAGVAVSLFHARLTMEDRQKVESQVLDQFGKKAERDRPRLLIATQVVEQSLDLDFDAMVSDLAPVDLLLQRAGRLHRHLRNADGALLPAGSPDQRLNPLLQVIIESKVGELEGPKNESVYSAAILRETQNWLGEERTIDGPQDVEEAVEAVYGRLDQFDLEAEADSVMKAAVESLRLQSAKKIDIASASSIKKPDPEDPLPSVNRLIETEEGSKHGLAAKTRLETLPSIALIIWPHGVALPQAPLGQEEKRSLALKQIRVTAHGGIISELLSLPQGEGWSRVRVLSDCRLAQLNDSGNFETARYRFHYSRQTGLYWETKNA